MLDKETRDRLHDWKFQSPDTNGFHEVIVAGKADCKAINMFRLNLVPGQSYTVGSDTLEIHPVIIEGKAKVTEAPFGDLDLKRFDSFYLPAKCSAKITAVDNCNIYIAGAPFDGIGEPSFRIYDPDLPIGKIHQIHGEGLGRREVSFTLDPDTKASRLICGITWGAVGAYTSWPPHQHDKDLEEAYCYFDMPAPKCGFHISYLHSGGLEDAVVHPVTSGSMVIAPRGYHPTCASPSCRNAYLWCLAAFRPESRRYDLAVLDPAYEMY